MKPHNTRTYVLFQEFFYEVHRELSKTTASGGYHSTNTIKEAAHDTAFEKLAAESLAFKAKVNKKGAKEGTQIQTDNSCTSCIVNNTVKQ
jgi:hypothetical protein